MNKNQRISDDLDGAEPQAEEASCPGCAAAPGSAAKRKGAGRKVIQYGAIAAAAALVAVVLIIWKTAGFNLASNVQPTGGNVATVQKTEKGSVQSVTTVLAAGSYPALTVQTGIPVRWNLQADASTLNSCNGTLVIPGLNIEKQLQPGDNIIEFTPSEEGTLPYSCKMGMIHSAISVEDAP